MEASVFVIIFVSWAERLLPVGLFSWGNLWTLQLMAFVSSRVEGKYCRNYFTFPDDAPRREERKLETFQIFPVDFIILIWKRSSWDFLNKYWKFLSLIRWTRKIFGANGFIEENYVSLHYMTPVLHACVVTHLHQKRCHHVKLVQFIKLESLLRKTKQANKWLSRII